MAEYLMQMSHRDPRQNHLAYCTTCGLVFAGIETAIEHETQCAKKVA